MPLDKMANGIYLPCFGLSLYCHTGNVELSLALKPIHSLATTVQRF